MSKAKPISSFGKTPRNYDEAIIYCRVSSDRQRTEGHGLESQEHRCRDYAKRAKYRVSEVFKDSFTGGGDFHRRPGLSMMLSYVNANSHKRIVVLIDDLSRFARDVKSHFALKSELFNMGVGLECSNFDFEDTPEGELIETMMAAQHQYHRKNNRRQVIQKQKARLEMGYWAFGSKRGYQMTKHPEHGKLSIRKEPDATHLQEALEGFADGVFQRKVDVCRFLVEKGFWKNQSPEKYIDKLTDILKDPFYAGFVEYPAWEVERRDGKHEGLVSPAKFELIQKRLNKEEKGRKIRMDINPDFPMRGLVVCGCCSGHLTAGYSKGRNGRHPYYVCHNKECEFYGKSLNKDNVEVGFDEYIQKYRLKTGVTKVVGAIFDKVWKEEVSEFNKKSSDTKKEVKELDSKISLLTDKVLNAKSEEIANAYERQIEKTENELKQKKQRINSEDLDLSIPYRTALEKATGLLKNPYKIWSKLDIFEKQKLFFFIFDGKIPYHKETGYRTAEKPYSISLFEDFVDENPEMWRWRELNPRAHRA
jgi:site-specific DNA recombinase